MKHEKTREKEIEEKRLAELFSKHGDRIDEIMAEHGKKSTRNPKKVHRLKENSPDVTPPTEDK